MLFPAPGGPSLSAIKEDAVLELSLTTSATKSGIEKVARSFAMWRRGDQICDSQGVRMQSLHSSVLQSSHFLSCSERSKLKKC